MISKLKTCKTLMAISCMSAAIGTWGASCPAATPGLPSWNDYYQKTCVPGAAPIKVHGDCISDGSAYGCKGPALREYQIACKCSSPKHDNCKQFSWVDDTDGEWRSCP